MSYPKTCCYEAGDNRGYALIITIGLLAVLVIIAVGFIISTRFEMEMAQRNMHTLRAELIADAGQKLAIAELKVHAADNFLWESTDGWYDGYSDDTLLDARGEYQVDITDCAAQININDTLNTNLASMLAALPSIDSAEAAAIINYRNSLPGGIFETEEQIRQANSLSGVSIDYESIKDYITAFGYVNDKFNRSPVNVNTAGSTVIAAVLMGITDGTNTISSAEAQATAAQLIADRPFGSWDDFEASLDSTALSQDEKDLIMLNCNPNGMYYSAAAGGYVHTSQTTEFCFHAGGYFELASTGTVDNYAGTRLANKDITSVVKLFGVIYETDKTDFKDGVCWQVTYYDDCPVDSADDGSGAGWNDGASSYTIIPDSLKIGFWEDFDEDSGEVDRYADWKARGNNNYQIISSGGTLVLDLFTDYAPMVDLGAVITTTTASCDDIWRWPDASFRCWTDETRTANGGILMDYYVAYIMCKVQSTSFATAWQDYLLGEKHPVWTAADVADYELPVMHPQIDHQSQTYSTSKTHKMVVSEAVANFYDNNMDNALSPWNSSVEDYNVDTDFDVGSFAAWGRAELPCETHIKIDNIRIIPKSPYDYVDAGGNSLTEYAHYQSPAYTASLSSISAGAIGATVTIPDSADEASEKLYAQARMDASSGIWLPAAPGVALTPSAPGGGLSGISGSQIEFKINFTTDDDSSSGTKPYFSETPVLEDVTLTYLHATQTLYYRTD